MGGDGVRGFLVGSAAKARADAAAEAVERLVVEFREWEGALGASAASRLREVGRPLTRPPPQRRLRAPESTIVRAGGRPEGVPPLLPPSRRGEGTPRGGGAWHPREDPPRRVCKTSREPGRRPAGKEDEEEKEMYAAPPRPRPATARPTVPVYGRKEGGVRRVSLPSGSGGLGLLPGVHFGKSLDALGPWDAKFGKVVGGVRDSGRAGHPRGRRRVADEPGSPATQLARVSIERWLLERAKRDKRLLREGRVAAAQRLQRHWRAWRAQRWVAARTIQCGIRGFLARRVFSALWADRQAQRRHASALFTSWLGWHQRRKARRKLVRRGLILHGGRAHLHMGMGEAFDRSCVLASEGKFALAATYRRWRTEALVLHAWRCVSAGFRQYEGDEAAGAPHRVLVLSLGSDSSDSSDSSDDDVDDREDEGASSSGWDSDRIVAPGRFLGRPRAPRVRSL